MTRIRNISIRDASCGQADAVYELRGDERDPISGVHIENVHVDSLTQFINNTEFVRNLTVENISWDHYAPAGTSE